jgi:hypothetical protein
MISDVKYSEWIPSDFTDLKPQIPSLGSYT